MRVERVREGLALAKKRGARRVQGSSSGSSRSAPRCLARGLPRRLGDARARRAPAHGHLHVVGDGDRRDVPAAALRTAGEPGAHAARRAQPGANGAWAMAHSAMVMVDSASREWVRDWASLPGAQRPHAVVVPDDDLRVPVRGAGGVARGASRQADVRLVQDALRSRRSNSIDHAGSRLGARLHGLRHAALRAEALRTLRSPPPHAGREPWVAAGFTYLRGSDPASSRRRRTSCARRGRRPRARLRRGPDRGPPRVVPPPVHPARGRPRGAALPGLFDAWYDANNGERGADMMLRGVIAAARARAEDFYFPAPVLHAIGRSGSRVAWAPAWSRCDACSWAFRRPCGATRDRGATTRATAGAARSSRSATGGSRSA